MSPAKIHPLMINVPTVMKPSPGNAYVSNSHNHKMVSKDEFSCCQGTLDNSRLTLNTQDSILNITEDDDDDIEPTSTLDDTLDIHYESAFVPQTPETSPRCCSDPFSVPSSSVSMTARDDFTLDEITEGFVESLCFPRSQVHDLDAPIVASSYRQMLEFDILELLGCIHPPTEDEMEKVWAWNNTHLLTPDGNHVVQPLAPRRCSLRERALRIRRLRQERAMSPCSTGCSSPSPPPTNSILLSTRTRSMDDCILRIQTYAPLKKVRLEDDLHNYIGFDFEPICTNGYDSDPEDYALVELSPPRRTSADYISIKDGGELDPEEPTDLVQTSFNLTWTLTWHPRTNDAHTHPMAISAWIERGTLVQNNQVMLEPNIMWREAYQMDLTTKRRLNTSTCQPFTLRLLNINRILAATPETLDRRIYPLAHPKCSFLVRTNDVKEYLFVAASMAERNEIMHRWKLCVARFACLAVLEDLDAVYDEFFAPPLDAI